MAATGEVTDFEQHEAELIAAIKDAEETIELATVVISHAEATEVSLDALQAKYGPLASATQTRADHVQGMGIDSETKTHAASGADALPPNRVAAFLDEVAGIKAAAEAIKQGAEVAKAEAEKELANIRRRYADAHQTVTGDLQGNADYLKSGGNGGGAAPQPATAGASR